MLFLDKKSYELLFYLLKLEEPKTIMAISKHLGQSRRKIYYHLDKINAALPDNVPEIVAYPRVGILLTAQQRQACQEFTLETNDTSYVMSAKERVQLLLIYIATMPERVTLEKLIALLDVSRNTTLNDLNNLRQELEQSIYTISLQTSKRSGYYLDCHPLSKIQFLYRLLKKIDGQSSPNFIPFLQHKLSSVLASDQIAVRLHPFFEPYFSTVQQSLGKKINDQEIQFLWRNLPYLLLCYRNMDLSEDDKKSLTRDFSLIFERKEYDIVKQMATQLSGDFGVSLDINEVGLIAMLLLSLRKDRDNHTESRDYDAMRHTLSHFLDALTAKHGLVFVNRSELLKQLITHCKALIYRKTYGIVDQNPLLKDIKEAYQDLFQITKDCATILEDAWLIQLDDDEVSYLTIHIGGELVREAQVKKTRQIVLVCDEGIAIQKLLFRQCQQYLPEVNILAVFTSEQFHSVSDLMQVDLVVTTTDQLESPFPVLQVKGLLTDEDVIKLIRATQGHAIGSYQQFTTTLNSLVSHYVKDKEEARALSTAVERMVYQELLAEMRPHIKSPNLNT